MVTFPSLLIFDATVIDRMPTFVFTECLWIILSLLCLKHALSQDSKHQGNHLLLWIAALFAGSMNDIVFMYLPLVDNFFHAQASLMLYDRLPLYILCVYQVFLYVPTAFIWQYVTSTSGYRDIIPPLTAFLAVSFYAPFDIIGVKFLWWTWHDTDNNTDPRVMGVPVSSTMWVGVFTFVFSSLLNGCIARETKPAAQETKSPSSATSTRSMSFYVSSFLWVCLLSVPLMMAHMVLVQILVGRSLPPQLVPPNMNMLICTMGWYGLILCVGLFSGWFFSPKAAPNPSARKPQTASESYKAVVAGINFSMLLHVVLVLYFAGIFVISQGWLGDSKDHVSTGMHQSIGPCDLTAVDYSGRTRNVHICESNMVHRDYFKFMDVLVGSEPQDEISWYSIRGLPLTQEWSSSAANIIGLCWVVFLVTDISLTLLCLSAGGNQFVSTRQVKMGKKE